MKAQKIDHFDGARDARGPQDRVENVRAAAHEFRKTMLNQPKVRFYQSFDLVKVPYPSYYGLRSAFKYEHVVPYMHILNRLFVVQFETTEGLKTLLVSPSDHERNGETPFFKRIADSGPAALERLIVTRFDTVPKIVERLGFAPEDIDYITYDHLHTQDVRRWLGTDHEPAIFPNAKLLVHRQEWESTKCLTPIQADWYCPHGIEGVSESKVVFIEGDVMLGNGVAMLSTPGHTEGNHSMVIHTDEGLWVTSENGVSVDAFAPEHSKVPGLKEYQAATDTEVILNGNTLEGSIDQYISMIQEKTVAGPSRRDDRFPNIFPSSEMTPFWAFPGLKPAFYVGQAKHGTLLKPKSRAKVHEASQQPLAS